MTSPPTTDVPDRSLAAALGVGPRERAEAHTRPFRVWMRLAMRAFGFLAALALLQATFVLGKWVGPPRAMLIGHAIVSALWATVGTWLARRASVVPGSG